MAYVEPPSKDDVVSESLLFVDRVVEVREKVPPRQCPRLSCEPETLRIDVWIPIFNRLWVRHVILRTILFLDSIAEPSVRFGN